ncbi:MAG: PASTA domain-containing protein [Saprospiraceae bacterium]
MVKNESGGLRDYLRTKDFKYTITAVLLFLGIFLLSVFLWLRIYTHHGQELDLPDYTGFQYEDAVKDAMRKKFRMSISDSLHILGKPGGQILKQNPAPHSLVKQKRMIYVTITKRSPDKILSGRLPEMYGKNFQRKKRELDEHFQIKSKVIEKRYDPAEEGQILEVQYRGQTIMDSKGRNNDVQIEKGDALDFIISEKSGGLIDIPNLLCKTYDEAQFLLENLGLTVGEVLKEGDVSDLSSAYIIAQDPVADGGTIKMESGIQLTVTQNKPESCN